MVHSYDEMKVKINFMQTPYVRRRDHNPSSHPGKPFPLRRETSAAFRLKCSGRPLHKVVRTEYFGIPLLALRDLILESTCQRLEAYFCFFNAKAMEKPLGLMASVSTLSVNKYNAHWKHFRVSEALELVVSNSSDPKWC